MAAIRTRTTAVIAAVVGGFALTAGTAAMPAGADSASVAIVAPATLHYPAKPYLGPVSYSARPGRFHIQASVPTGDRVICFNTVDSDESCGVPTTTDCAAGQQCWDYSYPKAQTADYPYSLGADIYDDANNQVARKSFAFYVDSPATQTRIRLDTPGLRPTFDLFSAPDYAGEAGKTVYECRFTQPGRQGPWAACGGTRQGQVEDAEFRSAKLHQRGIYELQAKVTDVFARTDPTPAVMDYSPTPWRIHHVARPSVRQLFAHGLDVRVECFIQVSLDPAMVVPPNVVHRYRLDGATVGARRKPKTIPAERPTTLRLRLFPGERRLRNADRLPLEVVTADSGGYYFSDTARVVLH